MGLGFEHLSRMVAWYSRKLICNLVEIEDESEYKPGKKFHVANSDTIIYTDLSLCKNCNYDCQRVNKDTIGSSVGFFLFEILEKTFTYSIIKGISLFRERLYNMQRIQ